jgi:uncharacterized protein
MPTAANASKPAQPLTPIVPHTRIHAIDAVRGFALLGIFLVNIQSFGQPFGEFILPAPGPHESWLDGVAFFTVKALCEGKFYPLFSMLFGMGVVLQWRRARQAGRTFLGAGVRRMLALLAFGLLHALLVWYGDVLFMYALVGLGLMLLVGARVRILLTVGGILLGLAIVLSIGLGILMHSSDPSSPAATAPHEPVPHYDNPFKQWGDSFEEGEMKQGPSSPLWVQTESQAYRNGPYAQVFLFRGVTWLFMLIIELCGFGWHVAAMFCLGAALMKTGIFQPERRHLRRRLFRIGLLVGLPLCVAGALLPLAGAAGEIMAAPITMIGGPLLSMAYLSGISLIVESGRAEFLSRALANVGRLALTNYLMQSLIATTVFYFYGLALFGQLSRIERVGMVAGVYLVQVAFSALWLQFFAYGPMEWVWRSLTYLRVQPMRRAGPE